MTGLLTERPFRVLDLGAIGMAARQLPVMVREPAPVPEPDGVTRVRGEAELRRADSIIVRGFPVTAASAAPTGSPPCPSTARRASAGR